MLRFIVGPVSIVHTFKKADHDIASLKNNLFITLAVPMKCMVIECIHVRNVNSKTLPNLTLYNNCRVKHCSIWIIIIACEINMDRNKNFILPWTRLVHYDIHFYYSSEWTSRRKIILIEDSLKKYIHLTSMKKIYWVNYFNFF